MGNSPDAPTRSIFKDFPDVMDVNQASKLLGVSTKTVYKVIRGGSLPSIKVGREYRILKTCLVQYLKTHPLKM